MLANLRALFGVLLDIILFRRGPESLPASFALLVCVLAAYAVVTALVASRIAEPQHSWPLELAVGTSVTLLWYHVTLTLARKRERFAQTMTALFACRTLFTPALLPVGAAVNTHIKATETAPAALGIFMVGLFVWLFVVEVRIARAALEWPTPGAVGLVLGQEFAVLLVFTFLFGMPEAT
jgi:hypothetical protein